MPLIIAASKLIIREPTIKITVTPKTNVSKISMINDPICDIKRILDCDLFNYNNFFCLKTLATSKALFLPFFVKIKKVFGFPVIIFPFLKALRGLSNLRVSGHFGYLERKKTLGNKVKHLCTNISKLHFLLLSAIERIPKRIKSLIETFLYNSSSRKAFFITFLYNLIF